MVCKRSITVMFLLNTTVMGGANISLINLIKELYKNNVYIYIVYPDDDIDHDFMDETKDIVKGYYRVKLSSQTYNNGKSVGQILRKWLKKALRINWLRIKREQYELSKLVKSIRPDIIHTNTGVIHSGYFVAKKYNIPHVWHIREYQTKDFGWEIFPSKEEFMSYLKDSYVISITKDILDYFGLTNTRRALCIYNGCFSCMDVSSILPKKKYFFCCSRVSEEKGHDEIIKAFSIFYKNHKDYRLIIAGFGNRKYIQYLHDLSKELGCFDAIEYVGFIKDIRSYMDYALALIVASRFEGFGRMTAEAAFRGCLVIGHNTGGTKEILEHICGIPFSNGYKELAEKMEEASRLSQSEYEEFINKSQEVAVNLYSNEMSAERVYDLYTSII